MGRKLTGDSMRRSKRQVQALEALNLDLFRPDVVTPPAPATIHALIREQAHPIAEAVSSLEDRSILEPNVPLPDIDDLYRLFDRYNWLFFEGRLKRPRIEYSSRMTSAGAYIPGGRLIRIGRKYHELFPDELADTLKHEMIHLLHINHDATFKAEARRIGASVRAKSHPTLQKRPRYIYHCPRCGSEYPRQKRLRMASCGSCSAGGRFDSRYKLVLKASLKTGSEGIVG
jgi:predicted SprT family Zn-dependent metalloprotease